MDPVASVRGTRDEAVQQDDPVRTVLDREMGVARRLQGAHEVGELMVVRRDDRPGLGSVVEVAQCRPRDREAVERAGPPAHLVQQDERVLVGGPEDLRDLAHLHHEARLPSSDLVGESHPGEQLGDAPDAGEPRRDERPRLGQDHEQSDLAHVRRLAGHVRPGEHEETVRRGIEVGIVRHEPFGKGPLEHRMPALAHDEASGRIHLGPDVAAGLREVRERRQRVDLPHGAGEAMHRDHVGIDPAEQLLPPGLGRGPGRFARLEDLVLDDLELLRDETLRLGDRLPAVEMRRDPGEMGSCDLDVVAEHLVVSDLEPLDPGRLLLAAFERRELREGRVLRRLPAVDVGRVTRPEQVLRLRAGGDGVRQRSVELRPEFEGHGEFVPKFREPSAEPLGLQPDPHGAHGPQARSQGDQLLGTDPSAGNPGGDPAEVRHALESLPKVLERGPAFDKVRDRFVTGDNRVDVRERVRQPERHCPPPGGRHRLVPDIEQRRALRVVRIHRSVDLEVTQRLRVQHEAPSGGAALDDGQMRQQARLRGPKIRPKPSIGFRHELGNPTGRAQGGRELALKKRRRGPFQPGAREFATKHADQRGCVAPLLDPEDLAGLERRERRHQPFRPRPVGLAPQPFAGRDVHRRVGAGPVSPQDGRDEEAVVRPAEDLVLHDRAGRHHAGHVAPDQTLRLSGVLDLVAQSDLVPFPDEAPQIRFDRVVRHAGHGHPDAVGVRPPGGEDHVQLAREQLGVVPERFVEIADAEQDQVARVA